MGQHLNPDMINAAPQPSGPKSESWSAAYLGVKPATLRGWRMRGKGPQPLRLGARAIRYELSALDAFLEQCRRNSGGR